MQINFNVSGKPTDTPVITSDHNTSWAGVFEGTSRCIFKILDTETGGAHLEWQGNQINFAFPGPGSHEASELGLPDIVYKAGISRIHVSGDGFFTDDGSPFFFRMNTDFKLLRKFIDGQDIAPIINERAYLGSNGVRVLGMASNLFRLNPEEVAGYYDYLHLLARVLADNGLYMEYVAFADQQILNINRFSHWDKVTATMASEPNVFIELANEFQKNGINPYEFNKPNGIICSQGSNMGDGFYPPEPGWDYHTWHGRRDWKSIFSSCEDLYSLGHNRWDGHNFRVAPAVQNEPIKFGVGSETNPSVMFDIGVTSKLYGRGCTYHFANGLQSELMDGIETSGAISMFRGLEVAL